jgi:putative DNA primase/helicase
MNKKPRTNFYTTASRRLSQGTPVDVILEMTNEFDIQEGEIKEWLEQKTKMKAISSALQPISREEQMLKFNTFDESFIKRYPNVATYRLGDNVFFYNYENGVYKAISDKDMEDLVDSYMFQIGLLEHRNNRRKVKDTVQRIGSLLARTENRHFKDTDIQERRLKLNLKNGLLDIETLKLEPHSKDFFSTAQVPFDYDPKAKCPKFNKFIKTVTNNDQTTSDMIQEMFGYCINDGNPQHKVFYLYGDTARNGKSTTAKMLCHLLGEDNYSTLSLKQLSGDNASDLVNLIGKQLNYSDEISTKYVESSMLTTISSEGIIQINPKYKAPFSYQVKSKFIVTCNDLPKFQNGQGMKHRMISIPFTYHIPIKKRIERYDEILVKEEGSGILNWAIQGAKLLKERGQFTINQRSKEDMHHNTKETNSVYSFMDDQYVYAKSNDKRFTKKSLYEKYKEYCQDTRVGVKAYNTFCTELKRFANETEQITEIREYNNYYYVGLIEKDNDF